MSERSISKKVQGKTWYTVHAPEGFDRVVVGETPADEPEKLLGRTIETTLGEIIDDSSENNTKLTFQITDFGSESAYTEFIRHELTRDYLRSLIRRGASKIDAVITVETADGTEYQVQPVAFTTQKADHEQERAIRQRMVDRVTQAAAERTADDFIDSIVRGRLSSAIYADAKEIYPLRRVEVQKAELEGRPEALVTED